jgi:NitT/TauT family transport system substrate-binding protein
VNLSRSIAVISAIVMSLAGVLAGCTGGSSNAPTSAACGSPAAAAAASGAVGTCPPSGGGASPSGSASAVKLTVGLGYIPSVQFAQFYYALQKGYYSAAGLDVTFQNGNDADLITLVGQGKVDIGIADGTSVIPAVSQGVPVRYVATIYAKFPNVVYSKQSSGISRPADLKGKKLGTPGKYGSSWIMLQALLNSAGLAPSDVDVQLYPDYGQGTALAQGAVEAATGFVNNEPVVLELSGTKASIMTVDQVVPLPGNGLIASTDTIAAKRDALKGFVAATLKAETEIAADPQKGLDAAVAAVPELASDTKTQLAILNATIATWSSDYTKANGSGSIDRDAWTKTVSFMKGLPESPISGDPPAVDQLVDESLLTK